MDGEYEADARRLIRFRGVDDRWRRIDRGRIVAIGLMPTVMATPAALLLSVASIVVSGERRRDGYAADH
jgi:hypothetical protein